MKIQTYWELESKDGLVPLLDHAFNWVFNQTQFEKFMKIDSRLNKGPVSFCTVEKDRIVGHVGVMDLKTRTLSGDIEYVGGVYGVATLPGHTRRGICTALMNKAHEYFKKKQYRFSFLSTSPALIAHSFYTDMGYVDFVEYPSAYKAFSNGEAKQSKTRKNRRFDSEETLRIYNEFTEQKTGFVARDTLYLRMIRKTEGIRSRQCIIENEGYAVFRQDKTGTWIRELVALNQKQMHTLIKRIEEETRGPVYDRAVLDPALFEVYKSRGYTTLKRGYGILMVKPLATGSSPTKTYGDGFYLTRLDSF